MDINFKLVGVTDLAKKLGKVLPVEVRKELAKTIRAEAKEIRDQALSLSPYETGQLDNDIKIKTSGRGLNARVGVFSKERGFVARILEFGSKPHQIKPRTATVLQVKFGFVKSINHPGFAPRPFLLAQTKERRAAFQEKMRKAIIAALKKE